MGQLEVEDHVGGKDELVMPGSVIKGSCSVRVVIAKLGTYGNELVRPPGNTDRMLGIVRGKASPAPDFILEVFISDREEGAGSDSEHRVVQRVDGVAANLEAEPFSEAERLRQPDVERMIVLIAHVRQNAREGPDRKSVV